MLSFFKNVLNSADVFLRFKAFKASYLLSSTNFLTAASPSSPSPHSILSLANTMASWRAAWPSESANLRRRASTWSNMIVSSFKPLAIETASFSATTSSAMSSFLRPPFKSLFVAGSFSSRAFSSGVSLFCGFAVSFFSASFLLSSRFGAESSLRMVAGAIILSPGPRPPSWTRTSWEPRELKAFLVALESGPESPFLKSPLK
mmetsp:Transcript_7230/g.14072  ORF Transcript_7230/g.14072 Transcript_7230/m.14072 type:complete len:203 (+) Transcript_7230:796-1404(+)